jgi:hypothetical protein
MADSEPSTEIQPVFDLLLKGNERVKKKKDKKKNTDQQPTDLPTNQQTD